jgi:hypothetical protein
MTQKPGNHRQENYPQKKCQKAHRDDGQLPPRNIGAFRLCERVFRIA